MTDTREIAEEGLKLMQTKLGTTAYLEQLNGVRQRVMGKREDRKIKRSIEVVTDPEKAAQKKIRQHEKVSSFIAETNIQGEGKQEKESRRL